MPPLALKPTLRSRALNTPATTVSRTATASGFLPKIAVVTPDAASAYGLQAVRMRGVLTRPHHSQGGNPPAAGLAAAHPAALLRAPEDAPSPVLRITLERARAGSRPGLRADDHLVCLAIEGGGMRGAVSAGMCVVLEAAGLVSAFDRVYGVSAGALNGWATAVGQAALSATHYQDAVSRRGINPMRPLIRRRPVVDFDLPFEELIAAHNPLSFDRLAFGPEFRALATSLETGSLRARRLRPIVASCCRRCGRARRFQGSAASRPSSEASGWPTAD